VWQPALIIDADADTHAATGAKKPWTICDAAKHMRQVAMAAIASVMILATPNATQAGSIDNDGYEKWYKEYQESVRRCGPEAEKKAINDARYIILAKLNKYLPNDFGEYEVILSLRGDIPVGSFIRDHAVHPPKDYPRIRIDPEPEYQAEIGRVLYYFGKTYEKDNTHYIVHPTPCMGRRKFYPENTGVSDVAKFVQKVIHPKIKN
jgi:hypothetical protein